MIFRRRRLAKFIGVCLVLLFALIASRNLVAGDVSSDSKRGRIYLVGVGPGDPELITMRAMNVIRGADLIVCWEGIRERFERELEGKKIIQPPKGVWIWLG